MDGAGSSFDASAILDPGKSVVNFSHSSLLNCWRLIFQLPVPAKVQNQFQIA
jgi:hypothetical protein